VLVLAKKRDAPIANYSERAFGTNAWIPVFVQYDFLDDDSLVSFFNKLNCHKIVDSSHDLVKWDINSKEDFIVKSYSFFWGGDK